MSDSESSLNDNFLEAQTKVKQWFLSNRLAVNSNETWRLVFSLRGLEVSIEHIKFLGVFLDSKKTALTAYYAAVQNNILFVSVPFLYNAFTPSMNILFSCIPLHRGNKSLLLVCLLRYNIIFSSQSLSLSEVTI